MPLLWVHALHCVQKSFDDAGCSVICIMNSRTFKGQFVHTLIYPSFVFLSIPFLPGSLKGARTELHEFIPDGEKHGGKIRNCRWVVESCHGFRWQDDPNRPFCLYLPPQLISTRFPVASSGSHHHY